MVPEPLRAETNAIVLSNFGNPTFSTTTSSYTIYGMTLHITSLAMQIEMAFDYVYELLGAAALTEPTNYNKIKLFLADFATLRVLGTLQGQVITKHFNYSSGGLNVQKPAVGQMAAMVEHYTKQVSLWRKMLLIRAIIDKGPSDLEIAIPNEKDPEGSGIMVIDYDSASV
jgi:hypothetical protein